MAQQRIQPFKQVFRELYTLDESGTEEGEPLAAYAGTR